MAKFDMHDLVAIVKSLEKELGHVPTKNDLIERVSGYTVNKFGFTQILLAAGMPLPVMGPKPRRLTNAIFERSLEEVLLETPPREILDIPAYPKILIIPDTHFPFVSARVLAAIYKFAEEEQPDFIIQIGDLYDLYAHSKFPRSQNIYRPEEEEKLGRIGAEEMWKKLKEICPKTRLIQMKGNHDIRPLRRTLESLPTLEHVVSKHLDDLMTFEGVELIADPREPFAIGNVRFHHGFKTKLGDHRDYLLKNVVVGHTHKGGVTYRKLEDQLIWELNAGFAGDPTSKVFGYTPLKTTNETEGFGYIDQYGPRFIAC